MMNIVSLLVNVLLESLKKRKHLALLHNQRIGNRYIRLDQRKINKYIILKILTEPCVASLNSRNSELPVITD